MTIVNMTPHAIDIFVAGDTKVQIPPSGNVARIAVKAVPANPIDVGGHMVPVNVSTFGAVEGLPEPVEGVTLIVSMLVREAVKHRKDVVSPDTGPGAVRDAGGKILGVRGFVGN